MQLPVGFARLRCLNCVKQAGQSVFEWYACLFLFWQGPKPFGNCFLLSGCQCPCRVRPIMCSKNGCLSVAVSLLLQWLPACCLPWIVHRFGSMRQWANILTATIGCTVAGCFPIFLWYRLLWYANRQCLLLYGIWKCLLP